MTVHLDVVTLFPAFFDVLDLSLIGRARQAGLVTWSVHDLRENTHDRHRTVDDSPYGGGAGMVMRPEPWSEALEDLRPPDGFPPVPLVLPTPSGRRFSQADAVAWARQPRLVFGCGRYEGIDARVAAWAGRRGSGWAVEEVSLGDYVLNGGEVAVLAIVEAVVRLLPGVVGNAASLVEESHVEGLVEHPVFTKPASWNGFEVPEVLLSGNHAAIKRWRRDESLRRTAAQRPDLIADYSPAQCDEGDLALLASVGWRPSGEGFVRVR